MAPVTSGQKRQRKRTGRCTGAAPVAAEKRGGSPGVSILTRGVTASLRRGRINLHPPSRACRRSSAPHPVTRTSRRPIRPKTSRNFSSFAAKRGSAPLPALKIGRSSCRSGSARHSSAARTPPGENRFTLLKMAEECERLADQCERLADQREQATHLSVVKV